MTYDRQKELNGAIIDAVAVMNKARAKFGAFHSGHEVHSVLLEEVDEFFDEVKHNAGASRMRSELVDVAAVALRAIIEINEPVVGFVYGEEPLVPPPAPKAEPATPAEVMEWFRSVVNSRRTVTAQEPIEAGDAVTADGRKLRTSLTWWRRVLTAFVERGEPMRLTINPEEAAGIIAQLDKLGEEALTGKRWEARMMTLQRRLDVIGRALTGRYDSEVAKEEG